MTIQGLTDKQKEILRLQKDGRSIREIARLVDRSESAVYESITSIRKKIPVIAEDATFLIETGYLAVVEGAVAVSW